MSWLTSLFCNHDFKEIDSKEYNWTEIDHETRFDYKPKKVRYSKTTTILYCNKCGKIKKVSY